MSDPINNPDYYRITIPRCNEEGDLEIIEVKDLIEDRLESLENSDQAVPPVVYYHYGNLIKYTMRWFAKGGTEDLKKARKYIDFILWELE